MSSVLRVAVALAGVSLACAAAAAADEADQVFESLYGKDVRRVQASAAGDDDIELAGQLLAAARTATRQPALLALLCEKAYMLAWRQSEGIDTAIAAMDLLAERDSQRRKACREKALALHQRRYAAARGDDRLAAGERLVGYFIELADESAAGDDYPTAMQYLRRGVYVAGAIRSTAAEPIQAKMKRFAALDRVIREIAQMKQRLAANPGDQAARSRLVMLCLVERDQPAEAAKLLDPAASEVMKTYVPLAASDPSRLAAPACLELAGWYHSLIARASPDAAPAMARRARLYYEAFLLKHTGDDDQRAAAAAALKKVTEELAKLDPPPAGVVDPSARIDLGDGARRVSGPRDADAMSNLALVCCPERISGLKAWTLETRLPRAALGAIAFSGDGKTLAVAGAGGTIRLLDAATGKLQRLLVGHDAPVTDLAFAGGTATLASASLDRTIRLWDTQAGRLMVAMAAHASGVVRLAWAPNGYSLASAGADKMVGLWNPRTGKLRGLLPGHEAPATAVAFSPDGRRIASGAADGQVIFWDARSGQLLKAFKLCAVGALAFSPDGKTLAIGDADASAKPSGKVYLCDAASGTVQRALTGHGPNISRLAWSPDGQRLACKGDLGAVTVWQGSRWTERKDLPTLAPAGGELPMALAWSPDGKALAACGTGAEDARSGPRAIVRLWNIPAAVARWTLTAPIARIRQPAWSFAAGRLAIAQDAQNEPIRVWDTASGALTDLIPRRGGVEELAWSPDGKFLAVGDGREIALHAAGRIQRPASTITQPADLIEWSPDGRMLAARRRNGPIYVLEAASGQPVREPAAFKGPLSAIRWSPDGRVIALGEGDGGGMGVLLRQADSGRALRTLQKHKGHIASVAWSADSRMIASGESTAATGAPGAICLWDARTAALLRLLPGADTTVGLLAFSPDGRVLAAGERPSDGRGPGLIRLWDAASGRLLDTLEAHPSGLELLAWSPDGKWLASVDGWLAHLWDMKAGQACLTILPVGLDQGLAFGGGGHFLASKDVDPERDLLYVTATITAQETLLPSEFAAKYGWKNDPGRVGK